MGTYMNKIHDFVWNSFEKIIDIEYKKKHLTEQTILNYLPII